MNLSFKNSQIQNLLFDNDAVLKAENLCNLTTRRMFKVDETSQFLPVEYIEYFKIPSTTLAGKIKYCGLTHNKKL